MKNQFVKRIISVLLSALMVITMIPTFAISAYADVTNHIVGAYLTRNATDGVTTTSGSVTWDNTNGAQFNGSSALQILGTPFNSVTNSSGFTITFEANTTTNGWNKIFNFRNSLNDATDFFSINGMITNDSNYQNFAVKYKVDGYDEAGIWTWDFFTADYFDQSVKPDAIDPFATNTNYRVTISVDASGYLYYYRDGTLLGKLKNNYYTQGVGKGIKLSYLKNSFAKYTTYMLGEGFTGYIKNVYLFDTCLTDAQAQSEISGCTGGTISDLETAITTYEGLMDGTVYTNMGPAYQAYVMATRARDAYKYGGDTTINLSLYIDPLVRATANMSSWTATSNITSATPTFSTDGNTNSSYYITTGNGTWYNNLLYTEDSSSQAAIPTDWRSKKYIGVQIRYPENTVLFYDGVSDSIMPVVAKVYNTGDGASGARVAYTIYPTNGTDGYDLSDNDNTEVQLIDTWHGADGNQDCFMYCISRSGRVGCVASNPGKNYSESVASKNSKKFYASSLKVINTNGDSGIQFGGKAYKNLNLHWQFYAGSSENSSGSQNRSDMYAWDTSSSNIYVLNYKGIKEAVNNETYTGYLGDIELYSQGGLFNVINGYNVLTSNISTSSHDWSGNTALKVFDDAITKIATAPTEDTAGYDTLRSYLGNGLGTKTIGSLGTYTVHEAAASDTLNADNTSNYNSFINAYNAAKNHMAGVIANGYTGAGNLATNLQTTFNSLEEKGAEAPTIPAGETYLGPDDTITINNNDSDAVTINYTITYNDATVYHGSVENVAGNGSTTVSVFNGNTNYTSASVVAKATKNNKDSDATPASNYSFIASPVLNVSDGDVITEDFEVDIANPNSIGTLKFSYDGENFSTYDDNNKPTPFTDNITSVQDIYAKIVYNTSVSETVHISVLRKASFTISTIGCDKGNKYYDSDSKILIENTADEYYSDDIYYTININGDAYTEGSFGGVYTYDKTNKINLAQSSALTSAIKAGKIVEITAYSRAHGSAYESKPTLAVSAYLTNADVEHNHLIYQESFDGASVDGTAFTTGENNAKGINATLINSNGASVVDEMGAGSFDRRINVLKINADADYATSRGNYIQFDSNPLSTNLNKAFANVNGITISFWRFVTKPGDRWKWYDVQYVEDFDGTEDEWNAARVADYKSFQVGDEWTNIVNFTSYDSEHPENRFKYSTITATGRFGFVQRDNDNGNAVNGGWYDYYPNVTDISNHSMDSRNGYWTNIAVTVNPNAETLEEAVIVYINGEPHEISSTSLNSAIDMYKHQDGAFSSLDPAALAKAIIAFYTSDSTHFDLAYGGYNDDDRNLDVYVDDIRIYTEVKTQVDINNMYTDEFSDSARQGSTTYSSSTSHDPTNVTVYTLGEHSLDGIKGVTYNGEKGAGDTVGIEFIEYYGVDVSTCEIEYYSFGTGLTVYKSKDNLNWEVVGDSKGRCGYQNQELFVSASGEPQIYTATLNDPLTHAKQGKSVNGKQADGDDIFRDGAAGKLVWAPHVMYNLTQDKWMYYGSTSAWVSNYSAVFLLTSDYVDHGYKYQQMIVKTSAGDSTNAIDSCVYYGHNPDGSINKDQLYCLYGSWGNIMVKTLAANGTRSDGETDLGTLLSVARGGGEGGYMTYRDGYYYYIISPGSNGWGTSGGAYQIRGYRSTSPTSGFASYTGALANQDTAHHGNTMMTGYTLDVDGFSYDYTSIGHSSIYGAYNMYNEPVDIIASHTREYSKDGVSTEDGQLSTRQIWLIGNVAIQNPVAYTDEGWPTAFPKLYDETFSTQYKGKDYEDRTYFTAYDIDGVYESNIFNDNSDGAGYCEASQTFHIYANSETTGVLVNTEVIAGQYFELSYSSDYKTTYITLYNDNNTVHAKGVIANQGTRGSAVPQFSYIIKDSSWDPQNGCTCWGIRTGDNLTKEEIVDEFEDNSTPAIINNAAYHEGTVATNGYSNVVYCSTATVWNGTDAYTGEYSTIASQTMRIALPRTIAMVYDGANDVAGPIVFENISNVIGVITAHDTNVKYVYPNDENYVLKDYWYGHISSSTAWPGDTKTGSSYDKKFGYSADTTYQTVEGTEHFSDSRFYWNKLYYNGNGDTTNYYTKTYRQNFTMKGYQNNWGDSGDRTGTVYGNNTQYVINYKPIYDILNDNTNIPGTSEKLSVVFEKAQASVYTPNSVECFYRALELINQTNPNDYLNNSTDEGNVESQVIKCANAIKMAISVFNEINLKERADFTSLDAAYTRADAALKAAQNNPQTLYTESSVTTLKNALATAKPYFDNKNEQDRANTEKATIAGMDTAINNAFNALETYVAEAAKFEAYEAVVEATKAIDPDAYSISQETINSDFATYTASISSTVDYADGEVPVVNPEATEEAINSAVTNVLSELTSNVRRYSVQLIGSGSLAFTNNGEGVVTDEGEGVKRTVYNNTAVFTSDDPDTAWYMEFESQTSSRAKAFQGYGSTFTTRVIGDIRVWAETSDKDAQSATKPYKISLQLEYSNKPDLHPVQLIDFTGSSYTLPTPKTIIGYEFDGYEIDTDNGEGNAVIDGNTVSGISGDIQIKALYTAVEGAVLSVSVANEAENAFYNDAEGAYKYNDSISIESIDGVYGWVEKDGDNWRPFAIGSSLDFYVTESTQIKAVTTSNWFNDIPVININKSAATTVVENEKNKTTFNGQIVVDNNVNVLEYGFLVGIAAPAGDVTEDLVTVENTGKHGTYKVNRYKSTKLVGANQFVINVSGLSGKIVYRGYIKYEKNGTIQTKYSSDTITINI